MEALAVSLPTIEQQGVVDKSETASATRRLIWTTLAVALGVISGAAAGTVAMIAGLSLLGTWVETIIGIPLIVAGGLAPVFGGAAILIVGAAVDSVDE